MSVWTAVLSAALIITIGIFAVYRRQISKICRQLAFLKDHKTNLRLTLELPFGELEELADNINEALDASRKAQDISRQSEESLKEIITNLSHDIRTPLTSLDGYFQLLSQSESEEEREHYIAVIQSRITSLEDMLEELFTYTKLQNESYELVPEPLDFGRCVYDTVFSFYDEFQRRGIEPQIRFSEEKLPITGNPEAIRRALQNIVKNALEHGQKQITLKLYREGQQAVFGCCNDVENPGAIDITQVFSRFYKADAARSSTSTGLGLAIAKELTDRMGGNVTAELIGNLFSIEIRFPLS